MSVTTNTSPDERFREIEKTAKNFGDNSMLMMSGIGIDFRGRSFKSESDRAAGIELRTRWIIGLWLPLIPISSYRMRRLKRPGRGGKVVRILELYSKEPLVWRQVFRMWSLTAAGIVLMLVVYYLS